MSDTLTIRLDEQLARALEEEAKRVGTSKGEVVRDAIRSRLRKTRATALDAFEGLCGIVDGPVDLSTNPRHLAGLGRARAERKRARK
jgi:predicted transcriptional regulator